MVQIINLLLVIFFSGATLTALLAAVALLVPGPVSRSRQALQAAPWRAFWLGLVNLVFFLALVLVLVKVAQAVVPPVAAVLGLSGSADPGHACCVVTLLGLAGLVALLRERMGAGRSPLAGQVWAAVLYYLAGLTPVVGWWVFTPVIVIIALGAGVLTLVAIRRPVPLPPTPPAP